MIPRKDWPEKWHGYPAPDNQILDEHAEYLRSHEYEPRPDYCFWCWFLAQRKTKEGNDG